MSPSMREQPSASRRNSLADLDLKAVRAELRTQAAGSLLRVVAAEALKRTTTQKAAAIDLELSEGRLSHKLKDGSLTLKQLEVFGARYAAEFGRALVEQHGPMTESASARARRVIPELIRELLEAVS